MKYLRYFENVLDKENLYSHIDPNIYSSLIRGRGESMDKSDLNRIRIIQKITNNSKDVMLNETDDFGLNVHDIFNIKHIRIRLSNVGKDIYIFKLSDEWFLLYDQKNYYKCDGWDGLTKLFRDLE